MLRGYPHPPSIMEGGDPPYPLPIFLQNQSAPRLIPHHNQDSGRLSDRGVPHPSHSGTCPPPPLAQKKEEGGGGVPSPTSNVSNLPFYTDARALLRVELSPEYSIGTSSQN